MTGRRRNGTVSNRHCGILYQSINISSPLLLLSTSALAGPHPLNPPPPYPFSASRYPSCSLLSDFYFHFVSDTKPRFPECRFVLGWARQVDAAFWWEGRGGGRRPGALEVGLRRSFSRFEKLGSLDVVAIRASRPTARAKRESAPVRNDSRALGPERSDDWEKRALEHMGEAIWSSLEQFGWDHLGSPGISERDADIRIQGPGASLAIPVACPWMLCVVPASGSGCSILSSEPPCSFFPPPFFRQQNNRPAPVPAPTPTAQAPAAGLPGYLGTWIPGYLDT